SFSCGQRCLSARVTVAVFRRRGGPIMLLSRIAVIGALGAMAVVAIGMPLTGQANGKHPHPSGTPHVHAPVPAEDRTVKPPSELWTNSAMLTRGQTLYQDKCAVCHGREGAGDGPAAASLTVKPPSLRDEAMVAEMSGAYWFWRISEGAGVEPFRSAG